MLQAIGAAIALPFFFLNLLGGITGGLWLLYLGEYRLPLLGILVLLCSTLVWSIILIPSSFIISPIMMFAAYKKYRMIAIVFSALSKLYTFSMMGLWAILVFY